jgi:ParB family transcriptional regulator, chromosome partitioning protein
MMKKGLGKGLGALLADESEDKSSLNELSINDIEPNLDQPRKNFDDEKLVQLADSIKLHGVVQPIIVKKENDIYRIVTGERRWRAARMAGLATVPAIVRDLSEKQIMEIALIENLQREDLNPVEEAEAYEKLLGEFKMTQEDISKAIGKSRPAIANSLRLLSLSKKIKGYIINGDISSGHGRALLSLENEEVRDKTAENIIHKKLSVRETENLIKKHLSK